MRNCLSSGGLLRGGASGGRGSWHGLFPHEFSSVRHSPPPGWQGSDNRTGDWASGVLKACRVRQRAPNPHRQKPTAFVIFLAFPQPLTNPRRVSHHRFAGIPTTANSANGNVCKSVEKQLVELCKSLRHIEFWLKRLFFITVSLA